MISQQKYKLVVHSELNETVVELRSLLKGWFDIHPVKDLKAAELTFSASPKPHAVIVECIISPEANSIGNTPRNSLLNFLDAIREQHPQVRRVVITDHCDLSLVINGLHSGAISNLIYKPLNLSELLAAMRIFKHDSATGAPTLPIDPQASAEMLTASQIALAMMR